MADQRTAGARAQGPAQTWACAARACECSWWGLVPDALPSRGLGGQLPWCASASLPVDGALHVPRGGGCEWVELRRSSGCRQHRSAGSTRLASQSCNARRPRCPAWCRGGDVSQGPPRESHRLAEAHPQDDSRGTLCEELGCSFLGERVVPGQAGLPRGRAGVRGSGVQACRLGSQAPDSAAGAGGPRGG